MSAHKNDSKLFRRTIVIAAMTVGAILAIGYADARDDAETKTMAQDLIRARRMELVDDNGRPRVVIAAPLGNPVVQGKEFPRSAVVHGIQLLDPNGNEVGGLGMLDNGDAVMLCFDHQTAEAVCLTRFGASVGLSAFDPAGPGSKVGVTGPQRFGLATAANGESSFAMSDRQGRARFMVSIGANDETRLIVSGADGKTLFQVPEDPDRRGD
ncbi:MAG: hypothetical protein JSU86_05915 [Phycisphaerales bacterium]|nr:MAG: hypothetical protein JSU86_05915 [Phycisphaerales bacterium]